MDTSANLLRSFYSPEDKVHEDVDQEMKENPFGVFFGRAGQKIERSNDLDPLYAYLDKEPFQKNTFVLTGPRGCGKTVLLSDVLSHYRAKKDWVVARINLTDHLLEQASGLLYEDGLAKSLFYKEEFPYSFCSGTLRIDGAKPVSTIESYLTLLLAFYKGRRIHVLLAIDDATKTPAMVTFLRAYQDFLTDELDVRLLMTGLFKNLDSLERTCPLVFRCRAIKILLPPLPIEPIAESYKKTLKVRKDLAWTFAKLTGGYATAYQLLGELLYQEKEKGCTPAVLQEYEGGLAKWSYDALWSDLTPKEKEIVTLIAKGSSTDEEIANWLSGKRGAIALYAKRLCQMGLIRASSKGKWSLSLPRLEKYVLAQEENDP